MKKEREKEEGEEEDEEEEQDEQEEYEAESERKSMRVDDTSAPTFSTTAEGQAGSSTAAAATKRQTTQHTPVIPPSVVKPQSSRGKAETLDLRDEILRRYRQSMPYDYLPPGTSVSSRGSCVTTDSIDLEKGILGMEVVNPPPVESRSSRQSQHTQMTERGVHHSSRSSAHHHSSAGHNDVEDVEIELEDKALRLLVFLSGPCAALSLLLALWAIISLIFSFLLQPFRLCARRPNLREQILSLLTPPLKFHLECVYTPIEASDFSLPMLLVVHILSPMLAIGVALWSWVIAIYWLFAAMVGNPDGLDGRNDGRELVLGLRRWWEDWLSKALKD